MNKVKAQDKLSPIGKSLEKSLTTLIKDLDATIAPPGGGEKLPKYSLLDKLRVYDRALKLEAIKHKIADEDGAFFQLGGADE